MARAVAEQARRQEALGDRGVLVPVQEDHPELVGQHPADLREAGEPRGEGDLVRTG
ncbi:hypothetical protein [Streptomyces sp. NRRL S-340]|uniref:hypothetical protein n=1 Tax=Streptomyces sp. NRRL S-340 TaxID=1463901 RepID=UPI00131B1C95